MSGTDHLARAREYIAKGDDYYAKAADEIIAAMREDPGLTQTRVAERLGRSQAWVHRVISARIKGAPVDHGSGSNKRDEVAKKVLSDPDQRREVIRNLPADVREDIVRETTDAVVADARAARAEHRIEPTVSELSGGDRFDPAEYWADTLVIRLNRNARELAQLIHRAGGLLFGTMPPEEAFDYLHEAERLIAEARAAAQEIVHDKTEVGQ